MNEQKTYPDFSVITISRFAKKYGLPAHLIRSLCKQKKLPGFYQQTRFYLHERRALETLNELCDSGTAESR